MQSVPDGTTWGAPVVRVVCALPVATAIVAVVQHGASPRAIALGVLASLPWVLLAVGVLIPWWLAAGVEIACTAAFVADPAAFDVAPLLLVILVGVFAATKSTTVSLATLGVAGATLVGLEVADRFDGVVIWLLGMALGWVGGFAVRLQDQAHAAREEQAADAERARIALELHDVVAHSLAVTMLNLSAARLALRRDPDEAEAALRQAEESGRQSMTDIRRVVGRLGDTAMTRPAPGAVDIEDLVGEFTDAGLVVTLSITGDLRAVPPSVGLTMYRIIQESIANVVKHAPGSGADVVIGIEPRAACIAVRNRISGRSSPKGDGGFGIDGMTERARLVGGTLRAGVSGGDATGDEWCVTAELPIGVQ